MRDFEYTVKIDANIFDDEKIVPLVARFGAGKTLGMLAGILIAMRNDSQLRVDLDHIPYRASRLDFDAAELSEFVAAGLHEKLFVKVDDKFLIAPRLIEDVKKEETSKAKYSRAGRLGGMQRWANSEEGISKVDRDKLEDEFGIDAVKYYIRFALERIKHTNKQPKNFARYVEAIIRNALIEKTGYFSESLIPARRQDRKIFKAG